MSDDSSNSRSNSFLVGLPGDKSMVVAGQAVRFILSSIESQNTIISRAKLVSILGDARKEQNCSRIPFSKSFEEINFILQDTYGMRLYGLPNKKSNNSTSTQNNKNNNDQKKNINLVENTINESNSIEHSKCNQFIVLDELSETSKTPKFQELLMTQTQDMYEESIINGEYVTEDMGIENDGTFETSLSNDKDVVFKGVLTIILSIVFYSKNTLLHNELLPLLERFGIPVDGTQIPILDCNIDDLLKTLERREYLAKTVENSSTEGELITYSIGRRTRAEFPADALIRLTQQVLDIEDTEASQLRDEISNSIGDAYL
ncbi:hypothetical protein TBLA_0C03200 [Henningerozyma blattae CBS 6284]|uniref:MAGE domain-containing protein n=1 Tax=Henningerozyma blattae (strain ATCC 34711 / CBS 6284 / DSM 70876 / NBRC 10599 / NRRL Y-10934 / UCD 77-7) TaxID=1071380 RepID=I2H172_HENB6|nr:hypothetical protein TBLA_0C03200 [Tetrapisispora blattae CBS 6284]CCH60124.1 hypothetical protein TBLA_0C03200 [Tetrapisispora blattae CBS 6284]